MAAAVPALFVYLLSLAPGITWAHEGADGGELLAAAVTNGVPHPPGYPLYMIVLRGWLALVGAVAPASEIAWRGNLLSALLGAAAVFVTTRTAFSLLAPSRWRTLWAGVAGFLWGISPLLWSQSILTEVYALHALIVALLGWVTLTQIARRPWLLMFPVAMGTAHHFTLFLLLPAVLYWAWSSQRSERALAVAAGWIGAGLVAGTLLYVRTPLVARSAPPVNWGYADSWEGFWWLVSGAAYRAYIFATPVQSILRRVADWGYTLASQYSVIGLALALWGLALWDASAPRLRNFSLLWLVPISVYALGYYTRDSLIYLLPVGWLLALWLSVGCQDLSERVERATRRAPLLALPLAATLAAGLLVWQWPAVSLRHDDEARAFLRGAAAVLEPDAILVSRSDAETFALWYGTWASGELAQAAPGLIVVNDWLYQFAWYARLQGDLHPGVPGVDVSVRRLLSENAGLRPIFYAEEIPVEDGTLTPAPPLWRYSANPE